MTTSQRMLTAQAEDGRSLPFVRPKATLSGAPLTDVLSTLAQSVSIPDDVHAIMVLVTEDMHIAFNATATSNAMMVRGGTLYGNFYVFPVAPGDTVSFIARSTTGIVYVSSIQEVE